MIQNDTSKNDNSDKEILELLYDHYKETNNLRLKAQNRRNREFVILCFIEVLAFLTIIRPELMYEDILNGVNAALEMSLDITNNIIQSFMWLIMIYVQIRYIQDVLYVERQYKYQSFLENKISKFTGIELFRESENYLNAYPIVLNCIDLFYKMICPPLFSVINIFHIIQEWKFTGDSVNVVLDTIFFLVSFVIIWFYFFEIHDRITAWFKKNIPLVNWVSKKLRKILKEV